MTTCHVDKNGEVLISMLDTVGRDAKELMVPKQHSNLKKPPAYPLIEATDDIFCATAYTHYATHRVHRGCRTPPFCEPQVKFPASRWHISALLNGTSVRHRAHSAKDLLASKQDLRWQADQSKVPATSTPSCRTRASICSACSACTRRPRTLSTSARRWRWPAA
ncbi:hypothetical protein GQ600_4383 [Phytophthora cactorum]|nr:hypothetical protein GQ600_4383 [Phytophthora cactorum]